MMFAPSVTPLTLRLRELREREELTQAQLAEKAGVRQATVSDLETGKTRRVDFDILERLAKALGVKNPGELLEWVAERKRGR